jgi:integrase/recombinase XerD
VVAWERRIVIRAREDAPRRARSKGGGEGGVPVPAELMRLWNDYMHEEYRDLDCDFVFVNLWGGRVGRPLSYSNVDRIVERTQQKVGFHFTAHLLRHYVDGWVMWPAGAFSLLGLVLGPVPAT